MIKRQFQPFAWADTNLERRILSTSLAVIAALSIAACGDKEPKSAGQSLVRVGEKEITIHQLNDELSRVDPASGKDAQQKILEALIDRQLLESEAVRNKIDRDPQVMQSIERARSQILAQAYLASKVTNIVPPSRTEIEAYFKEHPVLFEQRKQFDMQELVIDTKDFNEGLQSSMDTLKDLDEVAAWLASHNVQYVRRQAMRTTADLPPPVVEKLQSAGKGQLFVIKEAARTMISAINDVKISPVTLTAMEKQIEQFLINKKRQEAGAAELERLRTSTEIEYINKLAQAPEEQKAQVVQPAAAHIEAGVAGLK